MILQYSFEVIWFHKIVQSGVHAPLVPEDLPLAFSSSRGAGAENAIGELMISWNDLLESPAVSL